MEIYNKDGFRVVFIFLAPLNRLKMVFCFHCILPLLLLKLLLQSRSQKKLSTGVFRLFPALFLSVIKGCF